MWGLNPDGSVPNFWEMQQAQQNQMQQYQDRVAQEALAQQQLNSVRPTVELGVETPVEELRVENNPSPIQSSQIEGITQVEELARASRS